MREQRGMDFQNPETVRLLDSLGGAEIVAGDHTQEHVVITGLAEIILMPVESEQAKKDDVLFLANLEKFTPGTSEVDVWKSAEMIKDGGRCDAGLAPDMNKPHRKY